MTEFWEKLTTSSRGYVVAEAGVNHLGTLELGERLIREAKEAGADAIKFQSYKADRLTTRDAPRFWDWEGDIVADGSQFDSYSLLDSFGYEEHKSLKETCDRYQIEFLSTPFDTEAADYLERLDMQAYKIASCDLPNHPLLTHVSRKGRPIFLSTGG
ncbi:N-acetylneuraminate synthase family protein, partial [Dehalococcoidia bacterium]|nr:N-acetylneuraminate synthase family protein [Dehalococcoidia bacterium]